MAPTLLSMMLSAMLMNAFQDSDIGFPIRYCFDAIYSTLEPKVLTDVLDEFLYADDMNASSVAKAMDQVSQSCDNYDLIISEKVLAPELIGP